MEDFNSKYTGQQVEDLLDQVANGEIGGDISALRIGDADDEAKANFIAVANGEKSADYYICASDIQGAPVNGIVTKLYEVGPSSNPGIIGYTFYGAPTGGQFYGKLLKITTELTVSTGVITTTYEAVLDAKQDAITDLDAIREGASKGATALQPGDIPEEIYLADFTMASLRQGMNNGAQVHCDMNSLIEAMAANKIILVREEEDGYKGVYVLNGYAEDLLYFSIVDTAGDVLYCEGTDYTNSNYIDGQTLHVRSWYDKQDALVSGKNIKTINGESIVGEGDITIAGGSGEKGDKGDKGDTGVGVQSVAQTTTSNADGGSNVVTVTLTDGTKSTFTVKNGSKGSQGIQGIQGEQGSKGDKGDKGDTGANGTNGTNGKDGADGEDGATFTPSVDSAGNLSWSNNKGLANPPTVNIKGPKGDKGDAGSGGGGSSSGSGKEYIVVEPLLSPAGSEAYISNIVPNKTYIVSEPVSLLHINEFNVSDALSDEYNVIFKADSGETILSINSDNNIYWANGVIPTMDGGAVYELSIQRVNIGTTEFFNAVLTPFKLIE